MTMTREEAIRHLHTYSTTMGSGQTSDEQHNEAKRMAIQALSADKPQGKWLRISNDWIDGTCGARYFPIRCSVCGYSTYDDDATNFCPNCGADMRGEEA